MGAASVGFDKHGSMTLVNVQAGYLEDEEMAEILNNA